MSHNDSHRHGETEHGTSSAGSAAASSQGRLFAVLAMISAYVVVEVVGGVLTNSLALVADAGHMLTDVLGMGMALFAIRFAQRPATPEKTYGFYRGEILAALINSAVLFGVSGFIIYEAVRRFREPPEIHSLPLIAVAAGGVVVNLVAAFLLHSGSRESLNVRAAFLEVLSDLLGAVGVIVAGAIIYFTGFWPADPIASIAIALFILPRTWGLLKSAVDVLLEAVPAHIRMSELEAAMEQVPGVESVHDVHVWTITSGFIAMSGHVLTNDRSSGEVLHDLRPLLRERFGIEHATLQVERADHADDGACCTVDPRCLTVGQALKWTEVALEPPAS